MRFRALTFDVDGTLFDLRQMKWAFGWSMIRNARFLSAFLQAREEVRALGAVADLRAEQDARVARALGIGEDAARALTDRVIDREWVESFTRVKPIPGVREALAAFSAAGIKLATVSDYTAGPKLSRMGLDHVRWEADVGAEPLNALKPHPRAFEEAIRRLGVPPAEILHVGDRHDADIAGAHGAGMHAALFTGGNGRRHEKPPGAREPDFVFREYRELASFVGVPLPVTAILRGALLALTGFAVLFWVGAILQTVREKRRGKWVLKADTDLPPLPRRPRVSVVVPARNEERNIGACVASLRALDWPDLEILVMDDRSTDRTGEIVRELARADARIRVLGGTDLPEGWMGKCWALHQAQAEARGEWLLFLDADVQVHPCALTQAMAFAAAEHGEMFSGYGFLRLESFWEKVVMPVLGGMIVGANPLDEVNDPAHERVVCNGQFILLSRAAYDRIGGHAAVRGEIIDDVALAREAKKKGVAYRMVFCRQLFRTRMYVSLREIWEGWTKNLYAALGYRPGIAVGVFLFILATAVVPPLALAGTIGWHLTFDAVPVPWAEDRLFLASAAGTFLMLGYRIYASVIFDQDWRWFWSHPLGALVTAGIFLNSAWRGWTRRTVRWKGRDYGAAGPAGGSAPPFDSGATTG